MSKRKLAVMQDGSEPRYFYNGEIINMLSVFGEVSEPNIETVNLVEEIIRDQVVEIISQARAHAMKRGQKHFKAEDLVFILRHDKDKVNRLRTYLSWKDVRKTAKDSQEGAADEVDIGDDVEKPDEAIKGGARMSVKLPWEIKTVYLGVLWDNNLIEEEEEDEEMTEARQDRLRSLDEATRLMTKDEYLRYTDMRQASFTHRKASRFKEFLNLPPHMQLRANDDTIDILGFLAFEIVRSLCTDALKIKQAADTSRNNSNIAMEAAAASTSGTAGGEPDRKRARTDEGINMGQAMSSLFLPPAAPRTALKPEHIRTAFSDMQRKGRRKSTMMRNFRGGLVKADMSII